jgi:hypothetical protein
VLASPCISWSGCGCCARLVGGCPEPCRSCPASRGNLLPALARCSGPVRSCKAISNTTQGMFECRHGPSTQVWHMMHMMRVSVQGRVTLPYFFSQNSSFRRCWACSCSCIRLLAACPPRSAPCLAPSARCCGPSSASAVIGLKLASVISSACNYNYYCVTGPCSVHRHGLACQQLMLTLPYATYSSITCAPGGSGDRLWRSTSSNPSSAACAVPQMPSADAAVAPVW